MLPGGVYTTFRTFEGHKTLPLEAHFQRLEESASLLKTPVYLKPKAIKQILHEAVQNFPAQESRIRLTVDLEQNHGTVYISLEPLQLPPAEDYENGVWVVTYQFQRENPRAKRTTFISVTDSIRQELPKTANEGLMVDQNGDILEGFSSNFFAVKEGEIWTSDEEILPGITRSLVLQAAQRKHIKVQFKTVNLSDIPFLEEAFITSSSRAVLPVRQINNYIIGNGKPGTITRTLSSVYCQEIRSMLVEI